MTEIPALAASLVGKTVAVLGGTGPQGRGLARRFAAAGLGVVIGSRDFQRAQATASELSSGGGGVTGLCNVEASAAADIVVVAVPWAGHRALLEQLIEVVAGKVVVDCVNPLGFDKQGAYALEVSEGSAAQQAQSVLVGATVVGAFHNVSAVLLDDPQLGPVPTDVLVLGDAREATDLVQDLADVIPGVRGVYGGRLRNCGQVEGLTANLISTNRRYKTHAGVHITGL